ncbi:OLC1v1005325C1 [Oldenlandia corymbosa var. corymbosa]|uniref:OLC1v1005325C1 n=1 Tax=Oldenlandia corymbosa var. corymbosa TaxID=529605 RepID=A0AAV1DGC8_OLDCO|nr:OLC1v1005325C1 [Oldenlandia corymbosa var. corymbosa]
MKQGLWAKFILSLSSTAREKTSWARIEKVNPAASLYAKVLIKGGDRSFWYDDWSDVGVIWDTQMGQPPHPELTIQEFFARKEQYIDDFQSNLSAAIVTFLRNHLVNFTEGDDILFWKPTISGSFTLKSTFESIRQRNSEECSESRILWQHFLGLFDIAMPTGNLGNFVSALWLSNNFTIAKSCVQKVMDSLSIWDCGNLVYVESGYLGHGDSFMAEAYGLLFGIRRCVLLGTERVEVQTKNQALALVLENGGPFPWRFRLVLE